jgi:hypothetical protein
MAALLLGAVLASAGCRPPSAAPEELPGAASEPADEHARLAVAWRQGHSRWPLTELPLDEKLGPLLATLSAKDAGRGLRRSFDRQMAGQDAALREAARSLGLFGTQYLRTQGEYSDEERTHYVQIVTALGQWSATAPLGDRKRAHAAIERLTAAARATGLDGDAALGAAGMEDSLRRLGPFAATLKTVLVDYGLDLDRSLADLRTGLVEQKGDQATVRIHYPLGASEIDTTVSLTRRDGRWYLTDYLEHAAALLAEPAPATLPELPPLPPPTQPPAGPAAAR